MTKILNRYVLKEHVGPLLFALTTLTSLLLLNYIAKQFGNLVGKGLSWGVIAEFFFLSIPFTVAMTLPMAVLVSTLYAFSRLAAENEITALKASGVSMARVLVPVLWGATFLAAVMLAFNDQVLPRANHRLRVLQGDIARKKPTFALREQVINEVQPGKFYLKAGHLDEGSNRMREIVIYDLSVPTRRRTIYADSGNMGLAPNHRDLALTLYQGYMQELDRTDPSQLQRLFYVVNNIRIPNVANNFEKSQDDEFKSDRERSICEMQTLYAQAAVQKAQARWELEHSLVNAVRDVTGRQPLPDAAYTPSGRAPLTLGRLYCEALAWFGVKEAEAAEPPRAAQDTTRRVKRWPVGAGRAVMLQRRRADSAAAPRPPVRIPGAASSVATPGSPSPIVPTPSTGTPAPLTGAQTLTDSTQAAAEAAARAAVPVPPVAAPQGGPPRMDVFLRTTAAIEGARVRNDDGERTEDAYGVEIEKKFALAVACIVFVLLGAPIALRFPRGGVGLTIGVSLAVFAIYYVGLIAGEAVADRGFLSPFWAMWAANILFTAVGLVLLGRMGKEGSTARGGDMGEFLDQTRSWIARQLRRVGVPVERRRQTA